MLKFSKTILPLGFDVEIYIASGCDGWLVFVYSQFTQGDLRLPVPPSGQGASDGTRTRYRRVPADLRADSLFTVPPAPRSGCNVFFMM
ncbi:hypothetical protein PoB_004616200 [Plakobranchus ocellatus]|uniref:Uncharacterized protein n=1 Tax=Plakobranchus ocellatus TaxID=259542 RepID=A0AAV4BK06_9GAST|nr:hypothetical protein PoB_004616200 [Plakobranchus ocellatus]